jgi:hypothetical protein
MFYFRVLTIRNQTRNSDPFLSVSLIIHHTNQIDVKLYNNPEQIANKSDISMKLVSPGSRRQWCDNCSFTPACCIALL